MDMNIALILSGGTGARFGAEIPKQYIECKGRMIISYCIETFQECEQIDAIWVVADEFWCSTIEKLSYSKLKGFSEPGDTRQLSVLNGLEDIAEWATEDDIIVIHDAARPLVSKETIHALIEETKEHDGAIPVLPMKDTVYYSQDGVRISNLLERKCVYAGQAPESFHLGKYLDVNRKLLPDKIYTINGSTEPAILAGMDIAMIPGDERNLKITTPGDLARFMNEI